MATPPPLPTHMPIYHPAPKDTSNEKTEYHIQLKSGEVVRWKTKIRFKGSEPKRRAYLRRWFKYIHPKDTRYIFAKGAMGYPSKGIWLFKIEDGSLSLFSDLPVSNREKSTHFFTPETDTLPLSSKNLLKVYEKGSKPYKILKKCHTFRYWGLGLGLAGAVCAGFVARDMFSTNGNSEGGSGIYLAGTLIFGAPAAFFLISNSDFFWDSIDAYNGFETFN